VQIAAQPSAAQFGFRERVNRQGAERAEATEFLGLCSAAQEHPQKMLASFFAPQNLTVHHLSRAGAR
jgi:hypothetical protein